MIYLFIIVSLLYLSFKYDGHKSGLTNKQNKGIYYIVFVLIAIAAFSKNIGGDVFVTYWPEFEKSPSLGTLTIKNIFNPEALPATKYNYKPFYIITRAIIRTFTTEFWIYHIFHAIFINCVIFIFLKKRTDYLCLSILYYFVINYFEYNTEIIRESLAVGMGLLGFNQLERKRYTYYILFSLCAYMFHSSGLIVLLMPLGLWLNKIPKKFVLVFLVGIAIVMPILYENTDFGLIMSLMGEAEQKQSFRIIQTVDEGFNMNFYIVHYFKFLILPGLLIYFSPKNLQFKYIGLLYFYLLFRLMGIYGDMFYRFGNYYAAFFWMFMARSSYGVARYFHKQTRVILVTCIFLIFFGLNSIPLLSKDTSGLGTYIYQRYYPYRSIMFH